MSANTPVTCPRCGASASGNFCAACGASLGAAVCASCGTALTAGARFCHKCGAATGAAAHPGVTAAASATGSSPVAGPTWAPGRDAVGTPGTRSDKTPWLVAGVAIIAIIAAVGYSASKRAEPTVPLMANAGNAGGLAADPSAGGTIQAPNIDSMTPKERFIRLQTRIDQQLERKDTTRLAFFMDMALGAYGLLSEQDRDIDVRFHAAMLQAEAGMLPSARALADTILMKAPDNLLGYYVRATVAQSTGDSTGAKAARAAFRAHYDAEMKKNRPEYAEHKPFLEQYLKGAGAR